MGQAVGCAITKSNTNVGLMRPNGELPRLRGRLSGGARARGGTGARRGVPRLVTGRGLHLRVHRLAVDQLEADRTWRGIGFGRPSGACTA